MIEFTLEGIWSPIVMLLVVLLTTIVAYLFYKMGNEKYERTEYKGDPFISGNRPPSDVKAIHVGGDNLFWGFTRALKRYFDPVVKGHTGIVNDYIYWIMCTLAVVLVYIYLAL